MATYEISDPQGNKYQVTAPDTASQDEVLKYAQANFGKSQTAPSYPSEVASDIGGMVKGVTDYLNPFSQARHESYAKQAALPIGQAVGENLSQLAGTGKAMAAVAPFALAPVPMAAATVGAAAALPLVARGFQAANQLAGIDLPYEQAKSQVGTASQAIMPRNVSAAGVRPGATTEPAPPLSAKELKQSGADVFNEPAVKSIPIPADSVAIATEGATKELMQRGFRPTDRSAKDVFDELKSLQTGTGGAPINVDDLRSSRVALSKYTTEMTSPVNGPPRPTPNAEAARLALNHVDELINSVNPRIAEANANYSTGLAAESVDYRRGTAARMAAKSGTGSNIENSMRREVDKIPNRGLTPDERALKEQIVTGDFPRNALRKIGKYGFGDGLSILYHAAAAPLTGGLSVPAALAATGARKIGEALTRGQIAHLNEMIRARAPASKAGGYITKLPGRKSAALVAALLNR